MEKNIRYAVFFSALEDGLDSFSDIQVFVAGALAARGCKAVFFIEYVPVDATTIELAPGDDERAFMAEASRKARAMWARVCWRLRP